MGWLRASRFALMAATLPIAVARMSEQDTPIGDIARATRAANSEKNHAKKVLTNEDIGPQVAPVSDTDDPVEVVNKAGRALVANSPHTCRHEISNNSGPGSLTEAVTQVSAPDRAHMVIDQRGSSPMHHELIVLGQEAYSRTNGGPWQRVDGAAQYFNEIPEALRTTWSSGNFKLVRHEGLNGIPTLLYENKFHPGGVGTSDQSIDVWIGANDGLPRRVETALSEAIGRNLSPIVRRDITICSYGPVPEIKPPM